MKRAALTRMDSTDDALAARLDAVERAVSESTTTDAIDSTGVSSDDESGGVNLSSVPDLQAIDTSDNANLDSTIAEETSHCAHTDTDTSGEETPTTAETETETDADAEVMNRVGEIESRLNAITGELAAIRGLIESVSAVDEAVEQRANIALAKIEAIESQREENTTQNATANSETTHQYRAQKLSSESASAVDSDHALHDTSTCAACGDVSTPTPTPKSPSAHHSGVHDAVKQQSAPRSTAKGDIPARDERIAENESQSHRDHDVSKQEDTAENHTDDSDATSLAARLRAAFE